MYNFVYLVPWVNANDKGMNCHTFDSREAADIAYMNLRKMGRDPWIECQAVRGIEFAKLIG